MTQSQYLLFTSFLLISHLTTNGRAARAVTHTITDNINDLQHHCDFELNGYGYNLCPLMKKTALVEGTGIVVSESEDRGEGSSSGQRFYEVALAGLGADGQARVLSGSASPECDEDTWVCMLDMTYEKQENAGDKFNEGIRRPARATPIARNVKRSRKKWNPKATVSIDTRGDDSEISSSPLRLSLHGGKWQQKAQSAEIAIFCSEGENLIFMGEEDGIHSFLWATPHGCPTRSPQNTRPGVSIAQDGESENSENEDAPPEEKEGDDDLLPPHKSKVRRWIAVIIVIFFVIVASSFIFLSSTRVRDLTSENLKGITYTIMPLLVQATTKLRPIGNSIHKLTSMSIGRLGSPFRQGDSQLVRWAQEDMSLADSEDVMVNGSGAYERYGSQEDGWNADGLDEYIPLTISPKYGQGRRVKSYGATPDVETFAERGIMTGLGKYFHK